MEIKIMGMLSYKQYKLIQENFDSVIGLSRPTNLGLSEAPQLMMHKYMKGDVPPGLAKKSAPGMGGPDDDMDDEDHPHDDEGEDMGDTDMGDDEDADDTGDEDMGGEGDEEGGEEGDGMGDDGGMGGPMGAGSPPPGMGGPMGGPDMAGGLGGPPMKKKPPMMMKKMSGMGSMQPKAMYMKKEAAADPQDSKMKGQNRKNAANDQKDDGKGTAQKKTTFVREVADEQDEKMKAQNKADGLNDSCCSKCGKGMKKSKKCCKMTKEQREFNDSLMRQAGSLKFQQDEYGYWVSVTEDVLIQPQKQAAQDNEPQPGEVGFAPQAKVGILGSNFAEWAAHHASQVKKK